MASGNGRPSLRKRTLVWTALVLATFFLYPLPARLLLGEWTFPFDDPWIHQVYARNLVRYGQYAFHPGEPSSGSSAPLWTLLMAPPHLLGLPVVPWALFLGLVSLLALAAVCWAWAERHLPPPWPLFLTVAALLSPQIAWAGVEGMETALVAALALLILYRLDFPWQTSAPAVLDGLLLGLLLWLRPEAPLLTLVVVWQRRRAGWRYLLCLGLAVLSLAGPYILFHLAVGGRPFPQTVYAKTAYYGVFPPPAGFLRDLALTFAPGPWPLVALLLPPAIFRMARTRRWTWGPGLAWAGLTFLLAALRLPAVLHFGRHFVPVLPPLLLASGEALSALPRLGRRFLLLLGAFLLLIGVVIGIGFYIPLCREILTSQVAMGRYIAGHLPAEAVVASHDIGAIGYFGEHRVVDILALIEPEETPLVATRDWRGLAAYLQGRKVSYLACLEGLFPELRAEVRAVPVVRMGRMELYRLTGVR